MYLYADTDELNEDQELFATQVLHHLSKFLEHDHFREDQIVFDRYQAIHRPVSQNHEIWASTPGKSGQQRNRDNAVRTVMLPPRTHLNGWDIAQYSERWDSIESCVLA